MADLRIFSYLPNPRLYKATIAARYSGATIEVIGAKPTELPNWLWDYDARELSEADRVETSPYARTAKTGFAGVLFKTDAFMQANPYGSVPCAFGDGGEIGIFESNSILRAAARLGRNAPDLYGGGPLMEARIDGFLDRTLILNRDTQRYLLSGRTGMTPELHAEIVNAFVSYLGGLEEALKTNAYLASDVLTIADIAFACEVCQMSNELRFKETLDQAGLPLITPKFFEFSRTAAHLAKLLDEPNFAEDLGRYYDKLISTRDLAL